MKTETKQRLLKEWLLYMACAAVATIHLIQHNIKINADLERDMFAFTIKTKKAIRDLDKATAMQEAAHILSRLENKVDPNSSAGLAMIVLEAFPLGALFYAGLGTLRLTVYAVRNVRRKEDKPE